MSKGNKPAGYTTTTVTNPTQQQQSPFLGQLWQNASTLAQDPNIANDVNALSTYGAGAFNQTAAPGANAQVGGLNTLNSIFAGGNQAAPEIGMLNGTGALASGSGLNDLMKTAGGAYVGANPFIAAQFNAAADPVTRQFMTATAPQTDSNFEAGGRYGSGALANAQQQNQLNLGNTLQNLGANLYGTDYANERNLQTQAGQSLLGAGNMAAGTAGQLGISGISPLLTAAGLTPSLSSLPSSDLSSAINAPWATLQNESNILGQPVSSSSSTTQPYFQNGLANMLGMGLGAVGLGKGLYSLFS